jgi:hypothetical protein
MEWKFFLQDYRNSPVLVHNITWRYLFFLNAMQDKIISWRYDGDQGRMNMKKPEHVLRKQNEALWRLKDSET